MELEQQAPKQQSEIPFVVTPKQTDSVTPATNQPVTTDTTTDIGAVASTTTADSAVTSDPSTTDATSPSPTTYFLATSEQYPGSGTFDFPIVSTDADWNAQFQYTCDTGKVFASIKTSGQSVFINGTVGPFSTKSAQPKVVVPADQNCTWTLLIASVS